MYLISPNGHTPAAAKAARSPSSGASLTTSGSPANVSQLLVPFASLSNMSLTVWFSLPNKPIVLSFSIVQASTVTVRLSEGIKTTPKDVLSDSSASRPSAPTAFLWMVYLESESITFPTL